MKQVQEFKYLVIPVIAEIDDISHFITAEVNQPRIKDSPTNPTMDMQTTIASHPLNITEENNGEKSMDPSTSGE